MPASRLTVHLLGPVDIRVDGAPLNIDTRKAVALLAYLAVTGRPASRESLAALLWPEADGPDARGALRRTLSVLNTALRGRWLAIDRSAVSLGQRGTDIDVVVFRRSLASARNHAHDPAAACPDCDADLQAALALDRGPFMDGFSLRDSEPFDEWQLAESEAHRRDLAAALERLSGSLLAGRDWQGAISAGRRWLLLDPLHEPAHRFLMTAYAAAGETAAAVRQYRDCVRILDAELGVAPLDETTALYASIRGGEGTTALPQPDERPISPDARPGSAEGPLVGRDAALERLVGAVRSIGPDGRLLVIEGEPGIGKTRLARALVERVAEAGVTVLEGRAYAGEGAIPYAPIAELLQAGLFRSGAAGQLPSIPPDRLTEVARLVPVPGTRARAPERWDAIGRTRLLDALADVLVALVDGPVPGLIWLDDAHLADTSTLEALAFLVRRLRQRRIGVLLSWRREDLAAATADQVLAVALAEGRAEVTVLGRLSRDDVGALARAAVGPKATPSFVDRLYVESEGLPLYVAEALATPAGDPAEVHVGLDALVRRRLASVTEVARQVATAAAVIGRSFDLETVRGASGRGEEETVAALEELTRRGIVREVATADPASFRYDFTHARLRVVAYEDLGLARRRLLHQRVAEALTAPGRPDSGVRWPLIAHHERLAGRTPEAAEAHRRAGEQALSIYAHAEAREHLEAALALGHPAQGTLHEALGQVLTFLGDYPGAIAHLEAAAAVAAVPRVAAIEHQLGRVHARRGDWDRAESHLAAALAAAADDAAALRSAILADRSVVSHRRGDPALAETTARDALSVAMEAAEAGATARAEDVLGMLARGRGDLGAARAHLERALATANPASDPVLRLTALNTLALVLADAGEPGPAAELMAEARILGERLGDRHIQAALENNLADLLHAAGRDDESMDHLKRAVALFSEVGGQPQELEPEIWKLVEW